MALDVKVKIDLKKPIGKLAFGYPLILSIGAAEDYTECKTLDEVVTAGYSTETDTYKSAALMFEQNNPPAKIAVCGVAATTDLSAIKDKPWRQLVVAGFDAGAEDSATDLAAITTYIKTTTDKMFFATVNGSAKLASLGDSDRIVGFVHSDPLAVSALVGEAAGRDAGSFTYKNLILKGIEPESYTDTDLDTIHTANGLTFVTKAGDNVTSEGKVMSGEYIDIIDSEDYIITQLEYQTQKTLNSMAKVPYDNNGIAILESVAVNVMKDAYNKGIIATNDDGSPAYSVNYALRDQTDPADRAARKYLGGQFSFTLSGAIHTVEITGEIII